LQPTVYAGETCCPLSHKGPEDLSVSVSTWRVKTRVLEQSGKRAWQKMMERERSPESGTEVALWQN